MGLGQGTGTTGARGMLWVGLVHGNPVTIVTWECYCDLQVMGSRIPDHQRTTLALGINTVVDRFVVAIGSAVRPSPDPRITR